MAIIKEDKREGEEGAPEQSADEPAAHESSELAPAALKETDEAKPEAAEVHDVAPVGAASPTQLGTKRFVYAAYFAGAIGIAFIMSKVIDFAWFRLQSWKPALGEPRDEIVMPASAL